MQPDVHAVFFSLVGDDFERQVERVLNLPALLGEISSFTREWTSKIKARPRIADYVIRETLAAKWHSFGEKMTAINVGDEFIERCGE